MFIRCIILFMMLLFCSTVFSATDKAEPTTGFNLIGYIQDFTLDDPNNPLSGAKMIVNGITVIIPKNLKIVMPGSYLTANDIFRGEHGTVDDAKTPVKKRSCIALNDRNDPEGICKTQPHFPYTTEIVGNIADLGNGQEYIAGLVNIGQIPLQTSGGFIKTICYEGNEAGCTLPGELLIGPTKDSQFISGRVRLNDPEVTASGGRFGRASLDIQDDRFRADQSNPTVHAATGYPVCVPRKANDGDPECPMKNRPKISDKKFATRFTIGDVQAQNRRNIPAPGASPCADCDAHFMVPLVEGDYILYSGTLQKDANGKTFISAYSVEADLGVYTSPGVDPAYVFIEEALLGSGGTAFAGVDQETGPGKTPVFRVIPDQTLVTRFKIVGFTTDPSRVVDVFAMDVVDADSLEKKPRRLQSIATEVAAPIGRFELTVDQQVFMPPTREIRAQIANIWNEKGERISKEKEESANGLVFGRYEAPVAEYLFPEGRVFGGKEPHPGLIPANFEDLCFLSVGFGPLDTLERCEEDNAECRKHIVKKLEPWPNSELEPRQATQTSSTHQPPGIFCPQ